MIEDEFRHGKIDLDKTLKLLGRMQLGFDYIHVKYVFKVRRCGGLGAAGAHRHNSPPQPGWVRGSCAPSPWGGAC